MLLHVCCLWRDPYLEGSWGPPTRERLVYGESPPGGVIGSSVWCQHPPILSPVESASFDQQREAVKQKFLKSRTGFTVPLHGQSLCKVLNK